MEKYEWQLHMLQKENTKLKAVSAGIGKAETLSSANDKKRITELEEAIAVMNVEIVVRHTIILHLWSMSYHS